MIIKAVLSRFVPQTIWRKIRFQKIIRGHKKAANEWESLIKEYNQSIEIKLFSGIKAKTLIESNKIIWQYWAQGYESVPEVVSFCFDSVDKYCKECSIIRLSDSNIKDYLDLPEYVYKVSERFGVAFFSDLLRCLLLKLYGGVWLDATILLTAPLPDYYFQQEIFLFQRDPEESHKDYWENSYAYYFGWSTGFRVNMLSSALFAQKDSPFINRLCGLMLLFCNTQESLPEYFMFQILFDVLSKGEMSNHNCQIISDCIPHYLMQLCNGSFPYATLNEILDTTGIHKLSYKSIDVASIQKLLRNE